MLNLCLRTHKSILFALLVVLAQLGSKARLLAQDYVFPIRPGVQNFLSGSMGEIRSNHFHAGLDIKTQGRENVPVYVIDDGYVYRIIISPTGYGRVLYVQHANGRRSVYAHLNSFRKDLESYTLKKQYELESFKVELFPDSLQFLVKKGEQIALSGNTGSSGGPHLHFEIRQNNDVALNPLKYGFSEVKDNVRPVPYRIALKTFSMDSRVNGKLGRVERTLVRQGRSYKTVGTIDAYGYLGIEFQGVDRANGTRNTYGVNYVKVEFDGEPIYQHEIEAIPFELTQYINLFTDYYQWGENRKIFQKCYKDSGNKLPFYKETATDGIFFLQDDGELHQLKVTLIDSYGNETPILILLRGSKYNNKAEPVEELEAGVRNKYFVWFADSSSQKVEIGGFSYEIQPEYESMQGFLYAWNLRNGLPGSLVIGDSLTSTNLVHRFLPKKSTSFYNDLADIHIPSTALHDTLYLTMGIEEDRLKISESYTPLFAPIQVDFKVPDSFPHGKKYHMYWLNNKRKPSFVGGKWNESMISFRTTRLGEFELLKDTIAPRVRVIAQNTRQVRCVITDKLSGIKSYRATLNGKWLMMRYDPRKNIIWTERLDKTKPLKGDFQLNVTDKAGNNRTYRTKL